MQMKRRRERAGKSVRNGCPERVPLIACACVNGEARIEGGEPGERSVPIQYKCIRYMEEIIIQMRERTDDYNCSLNTKRFAMIVLSSNALKNGLELSCAESPRRLKLCRKSSLITNTRRLSQPIDERGVVSATKLYAPRRYQAFEAVRRCYTSQPGHPANTYRGLHVFIHLRKL